MDVKHVTHFTLLNKINIEDLNRKQERVYYLQIWSIKGIGYI